MRVPLGVIGIIYESRPNVTADAAGLCLKSGNAAILRGGSEALHSNQAIAACIHRGLESAGLPLDAVQVVETTDRAAVGELLRMKQYVDVIVPRGGKGLIERVAEESRVPVIKHLDGICHVYLDAACDPDKAVRVAVNAKTQRYGTCNTMETLLVDAAVAAALLPRLAEAYRAAGVEMNVVMELRSIPAIVRMVATTGSLGFVSQLGLEAEGEVHALGVRGLDIRRRLGLISRRGATLSPAASRFAGVLIAAQRAGTTGRPVR